MPGSPRISARTSIARFYHDAQITFASLPGDAPDLNPVEVLWGNIKGQELANLCPDDLGEVAAAVRAGMARVRRRPTLARAFLKHAGLSF